jgi:hypothetical protein
METKTNQKEKQISINNDLFQEITDIAKQYNKLPEQMAIELLNAQVWKAQHEQLFYPGLEWNTPKDTVIITRVNEADIQKLNKWLDEKAQIAIAPGSANKFDQGKTREVWLFKQNNLNDISES